MPTWDKILDEVEQLNPLTVVEKYIKLLKAHTDRSTICYMTAFSVIKPPVPQPFHSIIDQDMQGFMTCVKDTDKKSLDLILHTPGGDYEATKRIINYLQSIYTHIRVFIPHMAMSGGTVIACASDEIYMGPYSSLGPTDPQIFLDGGYVPVNAIIREFEQAFKEVTADPSKALLWNERLKKVPFGQLKAIENMKEKHKIYLSNLLKSRNCAGKDDNTIEKIVKYLSGEEDDTHSSHGKGIPLNEAVKLQINAKDLSKDKPLEDLVLSVYHAAMILFQQRASIQKIIINDIGAKYINSFSG